MRQRVRLDRAGEVGDDLKTDLAEDRHSGKAGRTGARGASRSCAKANLVGGIKAETDRARQGERTEGEGDLKAGLAEHCPSGKGRPQADARDQRSSTHATMPSPSGEARVGGVATKRVGSEPIYPCRSLQRLLLDQAKFLLQSAERHSKRPCKYIIRRIEFHGLFCFRPHMEPPLRAP